MMRLLVLLLILASSQLIAQKMSCLDLLRMAQYNELERNLESDTNYYYLKYKVSQDYHDAKQGQLSEAIELHRKGLKGLFFSENIKVYWNEKMQISVVNKQKAIYINDNYESKRVNNSHLKMFDSLDSLEESIKQIFCENIDGFRVATIFLNDDLADKYQLQKMVFYIDFKNSQIKRSIMIYRKSFEVSKYEMNVEEYEVNSMKTKNIQEIIDNLEKEIESNQGKFSDYEIIDLRNK